MPQDYAASASLVREVMKKLECENARQLGLQLWPGDPDAPKRVARWLTGKDSAPNFEATMLMLERAGMLSRSPKRRVRPVPQPDAIEALRDSLAGLRHAEQALVLALEQLDDPPPDEQQAAQPQARP